MRWIWLLLVLITALARAADQQPQSANLMVRQLTHTTAEPILAAPAEGTKESDDFVFAVVFPSDGRAKLVVIRREYGRSPTIMATSKSFPYDPGANYSAFISALESFGSDRFSLALAARDGCARSLRTHRFAFRKGVWMVVGVDFKFPKCTDRGIEIDRVVSKNYLTGKSETTLYQNNRATKEVRSTMTRKSFPLSEFPPEDVDSDYEEIQ